MHGRLSGHRNLAPSILGGVETELRGIQESGLLSGFSDSMSFKHLIFSVQAGGVDSKLVVQMSGVYGSRGAKGEMSKSRPEARTVYEESEVAQGSEELSIVRISDSEAGDIQGKKDRVRNLFPMTPVLYSISCVLFMGVEYVLIVRTLDLVNPYSGILVSDDLKELIVLLVCVGFALASRRFTLSLKRIPAPLAEICAGAIAAIAATGVLALSIVLMSFGVRGMLAIGAGGIAVGCFWCRGMERPLSQRVLSFFFVAVYAVALSSSCLYAYIDTVGVQLIGNVPGIESSSADGNAEERFALSYSSAWENDMSLQDKVDFAASVASRDAIALNANPTIVRISIVGPGLASDVATGGDEIVLSLDDLQNPDLVARGVSYEMMLIFSRGVIASGVPKGSSWPPDSLTEDDVSVLGDPGSGIDYFWPSYSAECVASKWAKAEEDVLRSEANVWLEAHSTQS